jgi:CheY-like chemotaxis protein
VILVLKFAFLEYRRLRVSLKVYYLDDEPDLLEIFVDTFSSSLVEITTFTDPIKAIAVIKSSPPDLLFLDFRLPYTTGLMVAEQLDPNIPKVLVTGDMSIKPSSVFKMVCEKPINPGVIEKFILGLAGIKKAA